MSLNHAQASMTPRRSWLFAILLAAMVLAQTALAWHEHPAPPGDGDCVICLQFSGNSAAVATSPFVVTLPVAPIPSAAESPLRARHFSPRARSRAPPAH